MKNIIKDLLASFDTHKQGFSARKCSAFAIMLCVVIAHIAWLKKAFMDNDFTQLQPVLIIDYGFITACFGMTTYSAGKDVKATNMISDDKPKEPIS